MSKAPRRGFPQTNHGQGVKNPNVGQFSDMGQSLAPIVDAAEQDAAPMTGRRLSDYNPTSEPNGDHQNIKSGALEFPPRS